MAVTSSPPPDPDSAARARDDAFAPPSREKPPKRSYARRRAGARTAPGDAGPAEEVAGPKPAPTIIEAAAAVHREQALGADDDLLPTMIDRSLFDEEDDELPPELADFKAALVRASSPNVGEPARAAPAQTSIEPREPTGPVRTAAAGLSAWGEADDAPPDAETSQRFETAGARVPKTKMLSPVEIAVELAGADAAQRTEAGLAPPRLDELRRELGAPPRAAPRRYAMIVVALVVAAALLALVIWGLTG